jgi:hypothetical protein
MPALLDILNKHQLTFNKTGRLAATQKTFEKRSVQAFGPKRVISADQTIAARLSAPGVVKPKSKVVQLGEAPDGFGKYIIWDPADSALALVVFLSAADFLGVMISGVRRTDTIEFVSATGLASFSEDTKNEGAGAFIGLIAAGASATATAFGAPAAIPIIEAGAKFAKTQFKEEKVKTKRRDAFGVDPGSGHKARQEGGVIVSLPEARTSFYSGKSESRWIKEPGTRDAAHLPDHVRGAFFLLPGGGTNRHIADADGDIFINAWDHIFEDNFGYYRLNVLLKRGKGVVEAPVE